MSVVRSVPNIDSSREFLCINACDGKERATKYGETLIQLILKSADLIVSCVMMSKNHILPDEVVDSVKNAIRLYDLVFTNGDYGIYNTKLIELYLYLSEHLWRAGKHDEAFEALDTILDCARKAEDIVRKGGTILYSSPLIKALTSSVEKNPDYKYICRTSKRLAVLVCAGLLTS